MKSFFRLIIVACQCAALVLGGATSVDNVRGLQVPTIAGSTPSPPLQPCSGSDCVSQPTQAPSLPPTPHPTINFLQSPSQGLKDCYLNRNNYWQCVGNITTDALTIEDETIGFNSGVVIFCPFFPEVGGNEVDSLRCGCVIVNEDPNDGYTSNNFCNTCILRWWGLTEDSIDWSANWDCSNFGYPGPTSYLGGNAPRPVPIPVAHKPTSNANQRDPEEEEVALVDPFDELETVTCVGRVAAQQAGCRGYQGSPCQQATDCVSGLCVDNICGCHMGNNTGCKPGSDATCIGDLARGVGECIVLPHAWAPEAGKATNAIPVDELDIWDPNSAAVPNRHPGWIAMLVPLIVFAFVPYSF